MELNATPKIMKEKLLQLRQFNWRLFAALCALSLIPAVYQTVRTFIISSNNPDAAFDIVGQMEWFDLINETLQAFLVVPLYSILNRIFKEGGDNFAGHTFKMGLLTFTVYALFSIGILIYGSVLVRTMNPNEIDVVVTSDYLRFEAVAFMIGIVVSFVNVVFVVVGKDRNVYVFLAIHTVLSVVADFALIPNFGVYGIAVSNIMVNALLAVASFVMLYAQSLTRPCWFHKSDLPVLREWGKVGFFSGMQQFIDNFIYAVMICKMVNMVSGQGNYWIANNFIWGWLLIPVNALAEVIKRDCKDGYARLHQGNYYFIAAAVVVVWAVTIPLWTPFFRYAENLPDAGAIFAIVIKLVPFYIAYIGGAIIDNIFVGLGKTAYNAINSLVINVVYYGIFFVLYLTNAIAFTMDMIIVMFGLGMVAHFALSLLLEKMFLKRIALRQ